MVLFSKLIERRHMTVFFEGGEYTSDVPTEQAYVHAKSLQSCPAFCDSRGL